MLTRRAIRCVLLHEIADRSSQYTEGLRITTPPRRFIRLLDALARDYSFVPLDALPEPPPSEKPPLLLTFDDSYASLASEASSACLRLGIPATFFVNARFLDNRVLALDNLLAHAVANGGMDAVEHAAGRRLGSLETALHHYVPTLDRSQRERFSLRVAELIGIDPAEAASTAGLYLSSHEVRGLVAKGFAVANHTYSHIHCRALRTSDDLCAEVGHNQVLLEQITGQQIHSFALPYGSRVDATPILRSFLKNAGNKLLFFAYRHSNGRRARDLDRVGLDEVDSHDLARELEVLPPIRTAARLARLPVAA